MRKSHRRDGSIVIFGDLDDRDELTIEPRIASFIPALSSLHCAAEQRFAHGTCAM